MKFLIASLFLATGALAAVDPNDPQNKARALMANRILTADPSSFIHCQDDSACSAKPNWKCQSLMKLCAPGNSPVTEATEGTCTTTDDCRPLYRCSKNKQCAFVGPRACGSDADCNSNVEGLQFQCTELPKNAPGKRCWLKCTNDAQCHGCDGPTCRIPANFREHIGCCGGVCQRKTAC